MNHTDTNQQTQQTSNPFIDNAIRIGLVALLVAVCFNISKPFLGPILWGVIIAVATYPIYHWLQQKTGLGNGWTATLLTALMLIFLVTPTVMLSSAMVSETQSLASEIKSGSLVVSPPPESVAELPLVGKDMSAFWTKVSVDPKATLGEMEPQIKKAVKWLIKTAGSASLIILILIFSIVIAGVFLAHSESGQRAAEMIFTRLVGDRGKALTKLSHDTITSVVNGILGIAVIQTLLAGMGFMAMDIPGAGVLALVCLVLAVVQIDILIILIPLSLYMFSNGCGEMAKILPANSLSLIHI